MNLAGQSLKFENGQWVADSVISGGVDRRETQRQINVGLLCLLGLAVRVQGGTGVRELVGSFFAPPATHSVTSSLQQDNWHQSSTFLLDLITRETH